METSPIKKKIKRKFSLNELGGAFGDWGTLVPFIIGYISIVKLNPAGIFLCLGATNIFLGIRYNLPLPVQPQKTIGSIALSEKWSANKVISTGFATGIIWGILGSTRILNKLSKKIPDVSVRGIQLGLALILGWSAFEMFLEDIIFGIIALILILAFFRFEKIPTAVILVVLGIFVLIYNGVITADMLYLTIPSFTFYLPSLENILIGMLTAGIGQILLTLTNVMIATISLIKKLYPDQEIPINANNLASNMGIINIISPFFGGMPLCHGSGGLAAQYAFGARTGGSMIIEGIIEVILGLFLSDLLFNIFESFPQGILAAMLLYTAFTLGKISVSKVNLKILPILIISALLCFFINITVGFIIGLIIYLIYKKVKQIQSQKHNKEVYNGKS
ncbi:MAG: Sulfate transporter family protein [Promethearchaeota archaeon]|nr:MAG: Sulfate transporter family protein [Candidatus Lokiarchaeota archaeon]